MSRKQVLLWSAGGFAAGCVLGTLITKSRSADTWKYGRLEETDFLNGTTFSQGNFYSNMTLLLGSPTASGLIDPQEYPIYGASANYPNLDNNKSLMARYLTEEVYETLHKLKTSSGYDLDSCIQTGIDNPEKVTCGIVAGDEECYDLFGDIFEPIITDRHRGFTRGVKQHETKLIADDLKSEPFNSTYVKSTHFLVGRCLRGFRFPPSCCRAERQHAENLLATTLESYNGDFAGTYIRLPSLSREQYQKLPDILQNIVERPTSSTLQASGSTRDWPNGRGIFYNRDATLFAWTNREDHLRLMYRDRQLDFIESFIKFCAAMNELESNATENGLEFAFHNDYGYLLTCPSGIGTALRAGVHMKIPNLLKFPNEKVRKALIKSSTSRGGANSREALFRVNTDQRFRTILKNLRLHMGAEDQETFKKGYVDVYNMDRLGFNEAQLVQHVANSVQTLINMEQRLEKKETICDLLTTQEIGSAVI